MELEEKANIRYKDSLFVFLFGSEKRKEYTLSLYNALNGTDYTDPDELEINTIENIVYIKMHNDVSFMLKAEIWLFEQQSTKCPNMPYRMLEYIHALYQRIIEGKGYSKYDDTMFTLPAPHFVVLYNGAENAPECEVQKLSDMYENGKQGDLDLLVRVYNINERYNDDLKQSCSVLSEYMWLVEEIRRRTKGCGTDLKAVGKVISKVLDKMPDSFEIKPILMAEKEEVLGMIFEEYNEQKAMEAAKEHAEKRFNEGVEQGIEQGKIKGAIEKQNSLIKRMFEKNMTAEEIADITCLQIEEVQKILKNISK